MRRIAYLSLMLASAVFLFTACGDNKKKEGSAEPTQTEVTPEDGVVTDERGTSEDADSDVIVITGNDQMKYDKTDITVKAGREITILFKSVGNLPADVMSHDLVVLDQGTTAREFGMEAAKAGSLEKMSAEQKEPVIAATKMLAAGEEEKITFTLDEPGKYEFVCTFPGHFASMNGVITAE